MNRDGSAPRGTVTAGRHAVKPSRTLWSDRIPTASGHACAPRRDRLGPARDAHLTGAPAAAPGRYGAGGDCRTGPGHGRTRRVRCGAGAPCVRPVRPPHAPGGARRFRRSGHRATARSRAVVRVGVRDRPRSCGWARSWASALDIPRVVRQSGPAQPVVRARHSPSRRRRLSRWRATGPEAPLPDARHGRRDGTNGPARAATVCQEPAGQRGGTRQPLCECSPRQRHRVRGLLHDHVPRLSPPLAVNMVRAGRSSAPCAATVGRRRPRGRDR